MKDQLEIKCIGFLKHKVAERGEPVQLLMTTHFFLAWWKVFNENTRGNAACHYSGQACALAGVK